MLVFLLVNSHEGVKIIHIFEVLHLGFNELFWNYNDNFDAILKQILVNTFLQLLVSHAAHITLQNKAIKRFLAIFNDPCIWMFSLLGLPH